MINLVIVNDKDQYLRGFANDSVKLYPATWVNDLNQAYFYKSETEAYAARDDARKKGHPCVIKLIKLESW